MCKDTNPFEEKAILVGKMFILIENPRVYAQMMGS